MEFLELLKYTLPALIVFITTYVVIRNLIMKDHRNERMKLVLKNREMITPLRLQAYERITLFLERISPNNIVMHQNKPGMSVRDLQQAILNTIRSEYEHNLSQQIYISPKAWGYVVTARSKLIKFINSNASKLHPEEPSLKLSQRLMEAMIEEEQSPTQQAIDYLKSEVQQLFG
jgi:hypothetical protein